MIELNKHLCPNCKMSDMSLFYEALNVPINSCITVFKL